jgi:hypothetical protein
VISVNPGLAPAYVELAFAMARRGDLKDALLVAQKRISRASPRRLGVPTTTRPSNYGTAFPMGIIRPIRNWSKLAWPIPRSLEVSSFPRPAETKTSARSSSFKIPTARKPSAPLLCTASAFPILFWCRDHYAPCQHLNGLRGIVHYRPDTARGTASEWLELDLWHDLPTARSSTAATPQSPATTN